ncbi:MAG: protein kinase [Verrucomicrobia bacterium]|nr:protein kinase [Verrucomicrobiota bacterium]MBS0637085.1 protein kinase [Verrucomicrobiota bacterium]
MPVSVGRISTALIALPKLGQKKKKTAAETMLFIEKAAKIDQKELAHKVRKAIVANDTRNIKELFLKTLALEDYKSFYNSLETDKKVLSTFKKLYCEFAIQQAVMNSSPEILQLPLVKKCDIESLPRDTVISTLYSLSNAQANKLAYAITAISKVPYSRHRLKSVEMLGLCIAGDTQLSQLAGKTKSVYKRGEQLHTARACIIDPKRNTFTILSKKHGDLNAQGAFKRVSDAIEVTMNNASAQARRVAHVRNKPDEYIDSSELDHERRYSNIITQVEYKSKNRPYETKTVLLQEVYDHDLYIYTGFTPEESRKKISFDDMIKVLEDVGTTLLKMHEDGFVHRDVKAKNILYRKVNGKVEAKLIDFGHTYSPDEDSYDCLRKRIKGYGTLRYTAPDLLEDPEMDGDPLLLAQAEDAYALGQCIFEVFFQESTPWGSIAYRALKKKKNADENRATAIKMQKELAEDLANQAARPPKTAVKELIRITSRLLEPNPKKRMRMKEFMRALSDLKTASVTMAAA